jgi:nitrogen fixation-related uncharacterized protein
VRTGGESRHRVATGLDGIVSRSARSAMPENTNDSGSGRPTTSERLEMMWNLSKAARDRFNVRNETEWKICFGLWTGFGVAAGFVVNSSAWRPGWGVFAATTVIVLLILGVFVVWTIKRRQFDEKDSQTAYFWESAIEQEIGTALHKELRPGKSDREWLRSGDDSKKFKPKYDWWHPGLWGEIIITVLFGVLVIGAVASVAGQPNEGKTTVNIDTKNSNTVDIEKMKVGPQK